MKQTLTIDYPGNLSSCFRKIASTKLRAFRWKVSNKGELSSFSDFISSGAQ